MKYAAWCQKWDEIASLHLQPPPHLTSALRMSGRAGSAGLNSFVSPLVCLQKGEEAGECAPLLYGRGRGEDVAIHQDYARREEALSDSGGQV